MHTHPSAALTFLLPTRVQTRTQLLTYRSHGVGCTLHLGEGEDTHAHQPMSTQRSMAGGSIHPSSLPRGETGRALCRWCALEVPRGRFTFCSEGCVHEWRMRTSPAYVRQLVLKRDKGICMLCRVNTLSAFLRMKKARGKSRDEMLAYWGLKSIHRRSLWDADHILPVAEGGGECDLHNLRTLCLRCHREATAQLRARLLLLRRQKQMAAAVEAEPSPARPTAALRPASR